MRAPFVRTTWCLSAFVTEGYIVRYGGGRTAVATLFTIDTLSTFATRFSPGQGWNQAGWCRRLDRQSPCATLDSNERSIGGDLAGSRQNGNGAGGGFGQLRNGARPRYDRKLEEILRQSAALFRSRGYHQTSIRDIARATGVSLAGLYYYFSSKQQLLYLIQRHAFEDILARARAAVASLADPEERLRTFIRVHLQYFLDHPNEMKVLTHEEEWLEDEGRREVHALKRAYYQLCAEQVEALQRAHNLKRLNTRLAVLSLFGMMNWIYTWYNPKVDPDASSCAEQMAEIFLRGIYSARAGDGRGRMAGALSAARPGDGHSSRNGRRAAARRLVG
jgi:AcrR family transcriptional regulator